DDLRREEHPSDRMDRAKAGRKEGRGKRGETAITARHGNSAPSIFNVVVVAPPPATGQADGYAERQADRDARTYVVHGRTDRDPYGDANGEVDAGLIHPAFLTISAQAASSITSIPSSAAFLSLLPAPGPATTRSVFALTVPAALAPSRSAWALASSRLIVSSLPVNTTVLPLTGLSFVSTTYSGGSTSLSRSSQTSRLCSSWKKSPSASTTTGPTPSMPVNSALAPSSPPRARSAVSRSAGRDRKSV